MLDQAIKIDYQANTHLLCAGFQLSDWGNDRFDAEFSARLGVSIRPAPIVLCGYEFDLPRVSSLNAEDVYAFFL